MTLAEQPVPGAGVPRLELREWADRYGLVAGISGAGGGFDLGLFGEGPAGTVMGNWLRLLTDLPGFPAVALARQVHGAVVATHESRTGWTVLDGADGHVTRQAGLLLAVTVADCVPVYLAHPPSGTVGIIHAGWRGTAAGIVEAGIEKLSAISGGRPAELVIHCGVGICGRCYEVGPEVVRAVAGREAMKAEYLDLRSEILGRARRIGIASGSVSNWCAAHDSSLFFSHRRSGGKPGRMAAYIGKALA